MSVHPELTEDKEKPISPCARKRHTREALTQSIGSIQDEQYLENVEIYGYFGEKRPGHGPGAATLQWLNH